MKGFEKVPVDRAIHQFVGTSLAISDRIDELLRQRGMTPKQLAEVLGKKESQISLWRCGTHNFTLKTIALLETALGGPIIVVSNGSTDNPLAKSDLARSRQGLVHEQ